LARVREGDLAGGREDLELAVALDPGNALLRSYLGKAYLEERRDKLAGDELATAKGLDPNDPTPWFYDAIRKQRANRPVEALRDLEEAIGRNDRRGVYRSRLLLDQDRAGRGASLARIYGDLGLPQRGVLEAARSLVSDPASPSAHRFLADLYLRTPRTEIARVSELLQAQLLQPLSLTGVQPLTGAATLAGSRFLDPFLPGFGDATSLFEREQARASVAGGIGDDRRREGEAIGAVLKDRFAASMGYSHQSSDGLRPNNDDERDEVSLLGQYAILPSLGVQVAYDYLDREYGDLVQVFSGSFSEDLRTRINQETLRFGARYDVRPGSPFANIRYSLRPRCAGPVLRRPVLPRTGRPGEWPPARTPAAPAVRTD
jgi:tetratricopeptide (TPR) repeat protein